MEKDRIAINLQNVSKKFKVYHDRPDTLKESILKLRSNKYELIDSLKNFNLTVYKGDVLGIIGPNGSGKSTVLKLISRIIYPSEGNIEVNGMVSSLLELGTGFHPDFSGKENVFINASIFGMNRKKIENKLDEIINFSELAEFIDTPIRIYSLGMYMRLAFSVAINVDADILIIDEILTVGDANFQNKCYQKLNDLKKMDKTIIIVSHDLESIEKLCTKAVFMSSGEIQSIGKPKEIIERYSEYIKN